MDRVELQNFINAVLIAVHQGDDALEAVPPDILTDFQEAGDVYEFTGETPDTVVAIGGKKFRIIVEEMP